MLTCLYVYVPRNIKRTKIKTTQKFGFIDWADRQIYGH